MDVCSLVVLETIVAACEDEEQQQSFYPCPCCRKPQVLNIESLQVRLAAYTLPAGMLPAGGHLCW